jgi:hypothetical protein
VKDLRNETPPELDEMFRRREGDVGMVPELSVRTRRRIRTRQGLVAAAAILAVAAATAIAVNLAVVGRGDPDIGDEPPAPSGPVPTHVAVTGRTDLFRWRVLTGPEQEGRLPTRLQTASLADDFWYDVTSTRLDVQPEAEVDTYLPAGVFTDVPNQVVLWGAFAPGVERVVIDPGTPCSGRGQAGPPVTAEHSDEPVWAVVVECGDGATVTELDASGAELGTRPLPTPQPVYVWAITTANGDGKGWILQRLVDGEGGVAIGDAGIPNDLQSVIPGQSVITEGKLGGDPVAWGSTPAHPDGAKFVFGLNARTVDSIVVVHDDGVVSASTQDFIEDPYGTFWIRVPFTTQALLLAFDASCNEVARAPVIGEGAVTVPADVCQPS